MTRSTHTLPAPGAATTPPAGRLLRLLRLRQPVSAGCVTALCAALAAPTVPPAVVVGVAAVVMVGGTTTEAKATTTIPGIGVVVKKNRPPVRHMATTDQDGRYDFKDLEPGSYDLLVDGQPPRKVVVGKDGRLSGVVTGPVKAAGPMTAAPALNTSLARGGPGALQPPGPAASDIRSVPTGNPTPVPKGAAMAAPPADAASGQHQWDKQSTAAPRTRQIVQTQALADGYFVKFAGQPQGFKLDTVRGTIEELPAGMPPRPAADAPVPAPARLQAFLKDQKTGQIVPLALGGDGFVLPVSLEDGRHRYALKVTGGGLGDRPCPPGCGESGYLTVSIEKGAAKGNGSPKSEGF